MSIIHTGDLLRYWRPVAEEYREVEFHLKLRACSNNREYLLMVSSKYHENFDTSRLYGFTNSELGQLEQALRAAKLFILTVIKPTYSSEHKRKLTCDEREKFIELLNDCDAARRLNFEKPERQTGTQNEVKTEDIENKTQGETEKKNKRKSLFGAVLDLVELTPKAPKKLKTSIGMTKYSKKNYLDITGKKVFDSILAESKSKLQSMAI